MRAKLEEWVGLDARIMIPIGFGLTIENSGLVGHAVGHNRTSSRTAFRVSGC